MELLQEKYDWLESAYSAAIDQSKYEDSLSQRQRYHAELQSSEALRDRIRGEREAREREKQLHNKEVEMLTERIAEISQGNKLRRWMPPAVCVAALGVMASFFAVLIASGNQGNGFSVPPAVLSTVGVSAVGGSLALVGFVLKGLFHTQRE